MKNNGNSNLTILLFLFTINKQYQKSKFMEGGAIYDKRVRIVPKVDELVK